MLQTWEEVMSKKKGCYRYVGVFRVSAFNFDEMYVVMKKDSSTQVKVKVTTRRLVTVITEETSVEVEVNL